MLRLPQLKEIEKKKISVGELRQILYRLDWKKIIHDAYRMRPSSWREDPILEWRNASDCVCFAVMDALEKALYKKLTGKVVE